MYKEISQCIRYNVSHLNYPLSSLKISKRKKKLDSLKVNDVFKGHLHLRYMYVKIKKT